MATVLDQIVTHKLAEIATAKERLPIQRLRDQLQDAPAIRSFFGALAAEGPIKLIAEVTETTSLVLGQADDALRFGLGPRSAKRRHSQAAQLPG